MRRVLSREFMDDPGASREELDLSLGYLRRLNRRFGGVRGLLRHLRPWSARWPRDRAVTLLDVATGSADIALAAVAWARRRGFDLRVTGVDLHPTTLGLAREHVERHNDLRDAIELRRGDARTLTGEFRPGSFDYVHAGLFLHHLPEIEVLTVLRVMDRLARAGIVWNDLRRSRVSLAALRVLMIGKPAIVKHDARVSIEAGFTRREVLGFARRLDLGYARYSFGPYFYRFTFAGEKPGAWR